MTFENRLKLEISVAVGVGILAGVVAWAIGDPKDGTEWVLLICGSGMATGITGKLLLYVHEYQIRKDLREMEQKRAR